jgi:hypothetical protein
MFKPLLEDAGLTPEICASLLGINSRIFNGWLNGTRDLPGYIIPELARVLGVRRGPHRRPSPSSSGHLV